MNSVRNRLGFGVTGPLAAHWYADGEAVRAIEVAIDNGIGAFDAGPFYGGGLGEARLGKALAGKGDGVAVFSKCGTIRERFGRTRKDFSAAAIRRDVEGSLRRLRREAIDVLYLHGPSRAQMAPGLEGLARLKDEGKIRRCGICTETALAMDAVNAGAEALMTPYNFLNRKAAAAIERAKALGRHVVAIAPLAQGVYAPGYAALSRPADIWKRLRSVRRTPRLAAAAQEVRAAMMAATDRRPLTSAALGYVLASDAVDIAVFTTTRRERIPELVAATPLSQGECAALAAIAGQVGLEIEG